MFARKNLEQHRKRALHSRENQLLGRNFCRRLDFSHPRAILRNFPPNETLQRNRFLPFLQLITGKIERGRRFVLHNKPSFAAEVNGVGRPLVAEKRKMMVNIIILKRFCTERRRRFSVSFKTVPRKRTQTKR